MIWRRGFAEFLGTFILLFTGCGAIIVNDVTGGVLGHLGVCTVWGLTVMSVIYALGEASGAHINPAVTIAFWLSGRMRARSVGPYLLAQFVGAICAAGVLALLLPAHDTLGSTIPREGAMQSLVLEALLSFVLMFIILNVATGSKETGIMAGVAIGSFVAIAALFGGPISGASMNPARSLGPALVSGQLGQLWIYFIGPLIGTCTAVFACRIVQAPGCCAPTEERA